jgi:hypothetical protein
MATASVGSTAAGEVGVGPGVDLVADPAQLLLEVLRGEATGGRTVRVHDRGGRDRRDDAVELVDVEPVRGLLDGSGLLERELAHDLPGRVRRIDVPLGDPELDPAAGLVRAGPCQREPECRVAGEPQAAAQPGDGRGRGLVACGELGDGQSRGRGRIRQGGLGQPSLARSEPGQGLPQAYQDVFAHRFLARLDHNKLLIIDPQRVTSETFCHRVEGSAGSATAGTNPTSWPDILAHP